MGTDIRINGNRSGASCRPGERIATEHASCNAIVSTPATAYVRLVPGQVVTVFGGTGFLGRRIVRHLHDSGFAVRIATRHPIAPVYGLLMTAPSCRSTQT